MKSAPALVFTATAVLGVLGGSLAAQRGGAAPAVWVPRIKPGIYVAPNRPQVKFADLKARHAGQSNWRELVVDDGRLQGEYISAAPGTKTPQGLHPDTRVFPTTTATCRT